MVSAICSDAMLGDKLYYHTALHWFQDCWVTKILLIPSEIFCSWFQYGDFPDCHQIEKLLYEDRLQTIWPYSKHLHLKDLFDNFYIILFFKFKAKFLLLFMNSHEVFQFATV